MASYVSLWGKNGFYGLLCFSLLFFLCSGLLACLSIAVLVTECLGTKTIRPIIRYIALSLHHMLPYLPSFLFAYHAYPLSTTVLLSKSPAFGPERRGFLFFPFFYYFLVPLIVPNAFFTSLLIAVVLPRCFWTTDSSRLPFVTVLVSLVLPKFYRYYSVVRLLWREWIFWPLIFLTTCLPLCKSLLWDEIYVSCIPLSLVSTICHPTCLPTYLQLVSLSSLHCHASLPVFSNREESFFPLPFLALLVPLVFPSAFFTCLLIH